MSMAAQVIPNQSMSTGPNHHFIQQVHQLLQQEAPLTTNQVQLLRQQLQGQGVAISEEGVQQLVDHLKQNTNEHLDDLTHLVSQLRAQKGMGELSGRSAQVIANKPWSFASIGSTLSSSMKNAASRARDFISTNPHGCFGVGLGTSTVAAAPLALAGDYSQSLSVLLGGTSASCAVAAVSSQRAGYKFSAVCYSFGAIVAALGAAIASGMLPDSWLSRLPAEQLAAGGDATAVVEAENATIQQDVQEGAVSVGPMGSYPLEMNSKDVVFGGNDGIGNVPPATTQLAEEQVSLVNPQEILRNTTVANDEKFSSAASSETILRNTTVASDEEFSSEAEATSSEDNVAADPLSDPADAPVSESTGPTFRVINDTDKRSPFSPLEKTAILSVCGLALVYCIKNLWDNIKSNHQTPRFGSSTPDRQDSGSGTGGTSSARRGMSTALVTPHSALKPSGTASSTGLQAGQRTAQLADDAASTTPSAGSSSSSAPAAPSASSSTPPPSAAREQSSAEEFENACHRLYSQDCNKLDELVEELTKNLSKTDSTEFASLQAVNQLRATHMGVAKSYLIKACTDWYRLGSERTREDEIISRFSRVAGSDADSHREFLSVRGDVALQLLTNACNTLYSLETFDDALERTQALEVMERVLADFPDFEKQRDEQVKRLFLNCSAVPSSPSSPRKEKEQARQLHGQMLKDFSALLQSVAGELQSHRLQSEFVRKVVAQAQQLTRGSAVSQLLVRKQLADLLGQQQNLLLHEGVESPLAILVKLANQLNDLEEIDLNDSVIENFLERLHQMERVSSEEADSSESLATMRSLPVLTVLADVASSQLSMENVDLLKRVYEKIETAKARAAESEPDSPLAGSPVARQLFTSPERPALTAAN